MSQAFLTNKTFAVVTFGCRVNHYESRALASVLSRSGWQEVDPKEAETVVVNACAVTVKSSRKTRRVVHRLCRGAPNRLLNRRVYLMGCQTAEDRAAYMALPQVRAVIPPTGRDELLRMLTGHEGEFSIGGEDRGAGVLDSFGERTRAYVKVQDGCDRRCSYCIVPRLRGRSRSRSAAAVVAEVDGLLDRGVPEIWVVGTDLPDWGGGRLPELLDEIASRLQGRGRIRLGTLGIEALTPELLAVMCRYPALCRHFHLSLQSGSGRIRRLMGRRTLPEGIRERVREVKRLFPETSFTADVMVGFPGETEEEFLATYELCRWIGFVKMHVFPYSARPSTRAARLPEQVTPPVAQERSARLRTLEAELREAFSRRLFGSILEVAVEEIGSVAGGMAAQYLRVRFQPSGPGRCRVGELVTVRVHEIREEVLWGELVSEVEA